MWRSRNQWRTAPFHWIMARHLVNEGFGSWNSVNRRILRIVFSKPFLPFHFLSFSFAFLRFSPFSFPLFSSLFPFPSFLRFFLSFSLRLLSPAFPLSFFFLPFSETKVCTGDFAPPEPEFRAEFWETNFGLPNFGPEFSSRIFWLCFSQPKRPPEKFTLEKFTSQNSHRKIHPRIRAEKFTLHFCRAILLSLSVLMVDLSLLKVLHLVVRTWAISRRKRSSSVSC